MKYKSLIEMLDEDQLYTPATIAAFAESKGFIKTREAVVRRLEKQRIRIALGRFSNNHNFPDQGDGMVTIRGQAPTPGWFGWRWKAALNE
jgi:hypothetical protein